MSSGQARDPHGLAAIDAALKMLTNQQSEMDEVPYLGIIRAAS